MVIGLSQKNNQYEQVQDPDKTQKQTLEIPNLRLLARTPDTPIDKKQFALMSSHRGGSMIGSIGFDWARSSGGSQRQATPRSDDNLGCDKYYFQFKPPNWITRAAWSIASSISTSGFDVRLRAYSVVSEDSPVIELAKCGDIAGLLHLFDRKVASPFDMTEEGFSLLDVSWGLENYRRLC